MLAMITPNNNKAARNPSLKLFRYFETFSRHVSFDIIQNPTYSFHNKCTLHIIQTLQKNIINYVTNNCSMAFIKLPQPI